MKITQIVIALCLTLLLSSTEAQKFALNKPIHIEADRVEMDEQKGISTYRGKVKIKQAEIQIQADSLTVYIDKKKIHRLLAKGKPVTMQRSGISVMRAQALQMEYFATEGRVVISGKAHLWQGLNEFSGERIEYHLNKDKIIAAKGSKGKQRVHVILHPQEKKITDKP